MGYGYYGGFRPRRGYYRLSGRRLSTRRSRSTLSGRTATRSGGKGSRARPKVGGTTARKRPSSMVKAAVREEFRQQLVTAKQVELRGDVGPEGFVRMYSTFDRNPQVYIRVPITGALTGSVRSINEVVRIKGVAVRMPVDHSVSMDLLGVCHRSSPTHDAVYGEGRGFAVGTEGGLGGVGSQRRLLTAEEAGILSPDGPFKTDEDGEGRYILEGPDNQATDSKLSCGLGKPIGKAHWKADEGAKHKSGPVFRDKTRVPLMRTYKWGEEGGFHQAETHLVGAYFQLKTDVKVSGQVKTEDGRALAVFDPPLELLLAVVPSGFVTDGSPVEIGRVREPRVTIYCEFSNVESRTFE